MDIYFTSVLYHYPANILTVLDADIIEIESEANLEFRTWSASEDISEEPFTIYLQSEAILQYVATGLYEEEIEAIESYPILRYSAPPGFTTISKITLTSEAILRYVSPVRLTIGEPAAFQIISEALFKLVHAGTLATEEIVPGYEIESSATLYYNHPIGLTVIPSTAAIQLTSRATLWYVLEEGIISAITVVTEPAGIEIESEAVLMYGGVTETLLRVIGYLDAISITSGALLYYYSRGDFEKIYLLPYQIVGMGALAYYDQGVIQIGSLSIELIESDPLLIYELPEGVTGIIETEIYETWALTSQAWNPSMYSNFNFNSYVEIEGRYYGAKDDGIYLLEGTDDEGSLIRAGVRLHANLGLHGIKRIREVIAEKCGKTARLRVTEPVDYTYRDFPLKRKAFEGNRDLMGREFIMDFQDFDELGHLRIIPQAMVRDGREG